MQLFILNRGENCKTEKDRTNKPGKNRGDT